MCKKLIVHSFKTVVYDGLIDWFLWIHSYKWWIVGDIINKHGSCTCSVAILCLFPTSQVLPSTCMFVFLSIVLLYNTKHSLYFKYHFIAYSCSMVWYCILQPLLFVYDGSTLNNEGRDNFLCSISGSLVMLWLKVLHYTNSCVCI